MKKSHSKKSEPQFLKNAPKRYGRIEEALAKLRNSLLKGLSKEQINSTPAVVWKTMVAYECLTRRTVETADGFAFGWNAENWTTAFTMGRSLIETAALTRYLTDRIAQGIEHRALGEVDEVTMRCLFGTRHPAYLTSGGRPAVNVLSLIQKLDSVFGKDTEPWIKDAYEYLCEFAHPNSSGLMFLNTDHDFTEPSIRFGLTRDKDKRRALLAQLGPALAMILIVEECRWRFQEFLPDLRMLAADPHRQ